MNLKNNLSQQIDLKNKLEKVGYAKCVNNNYEFTIKTFRVGEIAEIHSINVIDYCPSESNISFKGKSFYHYLQHFEPPTEKELLMHKLS